jgi:hypothetical protein
MPVEIRAITGWTLGPLTHELRDPESPVRRFFDTRFSRGAAGIQDRFRAALPAMVMPRATGDYATLGTAADWLLRYLVHPAVDYSLAVAGAELACSAGVDALDALEALSDLTTDQTAGNPAAFDGPAAFVPCADEDLVARTCWALALLTAVCRGGPAQVGKSGLRLLRGCKVTPAGLLALAPQPALDQLASMRRVFERNLLPGLATRAGLWAVGPRFAASEIMPADGDLIAGGLLLDLKTSARPQLQLTDIFQLAAYALMDSHNEYLIDSVGIFLARYGHLATWPLQEFLSGLAARPVDVSQARADFLAALIFASAPGQRGI